MMGVASTAPNWPGFVIVNVPPWTSSGSSLPERARSATSAMAAAIPSRLSRWAFGITGTIRPSSSATAIPRLTSSWWIRSYPSTEAFSTGYSPSASTVAWATNAR